MSADIQSSEKLRTIEGYRGVIRNWLEEAEYRPFGGNPNCAACRFSLDCEGREETRGDEIYCGTVAGWVSRTGTCRHYTQRK